MLKKIILFTFSIVFIQITLVTASPSKLIISIENIKQLEGNLKIALYDNPKYYLKEEHRFKGIILKVNKSPVTTTFEDIPSGNYAVSIFQDVNLNDKFDMNFLFMPQEPYGFSNNAKGSLGPPSFKDCEFLVKDDQSITLNIELR